MKKYLPLACLSPWGHHITLIDTVVKVTTWGVEKKKNTSSGACALLFPVDFILACHATFLI